jgi:type IV secretory pathway VirB4 component
MVYVSANEKAVSLNLHRYSVGALFMYGQTGSGKTHTMESIEQSAIDALFDGVARDCLPRGLYGVGLCTLNQVDP